LSEDSSSEEESRDEAEGEDTTNDDSQNAFERLQDASHDFNFAMQASAEYIQGQLRQWELL
jgi:hypothetical protein